jgi:hypothetical protein
MNLDRAWEKYEGGPNAAHSSDLRVTINRQGHIYMNRKAYERFGKPLAVALYYNREADAIAVEPGNERYERNFRVTPKDAGYVILAAPFCRHYRIKIPHTERFIQPEFTAEGLLILNLRQTVTAGGFYIRRPNGSRKRDAAS